MKKLLPLLAVFLIACVFASPTVTKTVEGPVLLDFGEKLSVTLTLEGAGLERLVDPIPTHFTLSDAPLLCNTSQNRLVCDLKGVEAKTISYELVASSMAERVLFERASLDYSSGGIMSTAVSNDIPQIYQIGFPSINLTKNVFYVNGENFNGNVFPKAEIRLSLALRNEGATEAKDIMASISTPSGWQLEGEFEKEFAGLRPAESLIATYLFRTPLIENFGMGEKSLELELQWYDGLKNRTEKKQILVPFVEAKLDVNAVRILDFEWKKQGDLLDANGTLEPYAYIRYLITNKGNTLANITIEQEMPELSETGGDKLFPFQLAVPGGGSSPIEAYGKASSAIVKVPHGVVKVNDLAGNEYPSFSFPEEDLEIGSTVWSTIFLMTKDHFPKLQIIAALVFFILSGYVWKAKGFLKLAIIATLFLCVALLYSTYTVLF